MDSTDVASKPFILTRSHDLFYLQANASAADLLGDLMH